MNQRIGVIDIGTNTLLLLIAEQGADSSIVAIVDECRFGRLGKGLDASGELAVGSMADSLAICHEYRALLDHYEVEIPTVIATQAMREARNAQEFVGPAQAILRAPLQVIAGDREAALAAASVRGGLPQLQGQRYIVVDVGGGSTEFIVTDGSNIELAVSVPVGAVRMTERFLKSDPPLQAEVAALDTFLASALGALHLPQGLAMIGTAGTATTLAAIHLQLSTYSADRVTGVTFTPAQLENICQRISSASVSERKTWPGMVAQRADVIAGGTAILQAAVKAAQATAFTVCDRGIRWGMATELLAGN